MVEKRDLEFVLHHCPESRSMETLWLLNELGTEFKLVTHGFGRNLQSPEYLSIHPLGRVPSLEFGGAALYESGAIAEFLGESSGRDDLSRAPDHPDRAEWLQWVHYCETMTVHLANLTQQFVALADKEMRSPVVIKLEKHRLEKAIGVVEENLADRDYMLGAQFSIADIGIGYALYVARLFTDLDQFPKSKALLARLSARPAFQASLPAANEPHKFYDDSGYSM